MFGGCDFTGKQLDKWGGSEALVVTFARRCNDSFTESEQSATLSVKSYIAGAGGTMALVVEKGDENICEGTEQQLQRGQEERNAESGGPRLRGGDETLTVEKLTVRRLTPLECCRLQGFPDEWCQGLEIAEPTDDDLKFWRKVFDEYAAINRKKPRSDKQIIKWLQSPHGDSAEYKMWGNGIALPCAEFIMHGIAEVLRKEGKHEQGRLGVGDNHPQA